jgi:GNAT superfamily N-acetyltransferase
MTVEILPATAERFDDATHAVAHGDGPSCQCQWWMVRPSEFDRLRKPERERMLRDELATDPAPALLAYTDDDAAGWVRVGPRPPQTRIFRTRAFSGLLAEPADDADMWAITCFAVRREHRGEGLMSRLLDAAIAHARDHGARVIEGYPVDTAAGRHSDAELYHGTMSVFEAAGFAVVGRPREDRAVVALELRA